MKNTIIYIKCCAIVCYGKEKPGISFAKLYFFRADGTAVDPDSGLVDSTHVYISGKTKYFAILCNTDIQRDKNSYYKLQLLEAENKKRYVGNIRHLVKINIYFITRSFHALSTLDTTSSEPGAALAPQSAAINWKISVT